jgi:hypothetical protein
MQNIHTNQLNIDSIFSIRYSIGYGIFLDVISRTFFFIRFILSLAIRTFGSSEEVKLNPRNFRFHGRSTADFFFVHLET